jgi:predicted TIM-barrel fold metal-dependent hydrolase
MLPLVDLHCHYCVGRKDAIDNFRRLTDSEEIYRIAVCALDTKVEYDPQFPCLSQFRTTNEQLAEMIAKIASPKLVPWCFIDPLEPDAPAKAEYWLTTGGMKGVKMYPPMGWYPNDPRAIEVFKVIAAHDVPVLLHMGRVAVHPRILSKFGRPICLEEVGLACPKIKLIIGHWANMWRWEAFHVAMSFPNFFFDLTTSGSLHIPIIHETIRHEDLGLRRILLGTDGAGENNIQRCKATLAKLRVEGGLTDRQLDAIGHYNGLAVLGETSPYAPKE